MTTKRKIIGRLVPCRCFRGEEEIVSVLDYSHCGLQQVPKEVFNFERTLEELYLDANQIEELPKQLFNCQALRKLSIPDNDLSSLPTTIASLVNLRELDISKNGIQDFPENIKCCKCLTIIEASVNPVSKLPDGFTQLLNLTQLYLNDAFLEFLPANFGRLVKLRILELRENHLKTLPKILRAVIRKPNGTFESHAVNVGLSSSNILENNLKMLYRSTISECQRSAQDVLHGMGMAARRNCTDSHSFSTADYAAGWERAAVNVTAAWSYSPPDLTGVWYWGYISFYDSSGYVQELGASLEESRAQLNFLQQHTWIDNMSRAVFVELMQYNPSVDLHAAITLQLEFLGAGQAIATVTISPFPLLRLSGGVTLQLLMMVFLMMFVVYFVVSESLSIKKEGRAYFTLWGNYSQWVFILLTTSTVVVHLSQATLADQQWLKYLNNRKGFTNFYQVAFLSTIFSTLAASLLFLLTVQAAQQLRFVRQWSVFGKTFQKSAKELTAAGLAFAILILAYAQLGFLLFSSSSESFRSVGSSLLLLFAMLRGSVTLRPCLPESSGLYYLFCTSYIILEVWILLRLFTVVLIYSYREMHFELYRPAFEPQDYEMVELFVRRLKMWMGFSKAKEFRHKVRFEGMEPLPSRDSSDSKSFRGPTPSAASDSSRASTSSSQLDGLSLVLSTRDSLEVDADIQRLLSLFEMLLAQFDRVNQVTEDVYRIEHQLEGSRSRRCRRRYAPLLEDARRMPRAEQGPSPEIPSDTDPQPPRDAPLSPHSPAARPGSRGSVPSRLLRASRAIGVAASAPPPHKPYAAAAAAAAVAPAVKKKRPLRAKNRVHPAVK